MKAPLAALVASTALVAASPAQTPAALAVDASCPSYAATHTLVRNDVLAVMDACEQNLPKAEATLKQAEADLQALKAAFDTLQAQKRLLTDHVDRLEATLKWQRDVCSGTPHDVENAIEDAWEWADAPLAFTAGAGMCIGVAWGLRQAQR